MDTSRPAPGPLTGFTIGVTAYRRADEQIELLERRGATVVHGAAIQTHPLVAEADLAAATRALVERPPDCTLLTTGIGVRAWFEAAESLGLAGALLDALAQSVVLARGPKAHGAAVTNGLTVDWQTPNGWAAEMVDHLAGLDIAGARVAVQLDGASGAPLAKAVVEIGAEVVAVPVYEWTMPADTGPAERLIEAIVDGRVDGITFTARPQVENLATIAERTGRLDELLAALAGPVTTVCVGPVCASGITDLGLGEPVQPRRHRLGSMVRAVADEFVDRARDLTLAGVRVRIQGRAVLVPDGDGTRTVLLTDRERAVLDALAERPGVVLAKDELLERVWAGTESDPHVVEVTVGRLRQRLGPAGAGIETVIRRGYRLAER